jgi:hypothetical protein
VHGIHVNLSRIRLLVSSVHLGVLVLVNRHLNIDLLAPALADGLDEIPEARVWVTSFVKHKLRLGELVGALDLVARLLTIFAVASQTILLTALYVVVHSQCRWASH